MSLHALANHMATKGRNGDSMLVHMTPGEVAGLHALALKHGGELTINPDTGLPEASFLKSLLPMLAGAALNFFVPGLGAAVGGAFGVGAAAGTGIAVGGITGLATGSLSRGLMAGLGAYGGAGLTEGLMGAGADSATRAALSAEGALPSLENITQVTGEGYGGSAANYSDQVNSAVKAARDASSAMPTSELMSKGFDAVKADPLGFAKQNLMPLAAAAGPIAADLMTPTVTKMPDISSNADIRQSIYDPYSGTYRRLNPVPAKNYGTPAWSPYKSAANGGSVGEGIVALAGGGVPGYAGNTGSVVGGGGLENIYRNLGGEEVYKKIADEYLGKTGGNTAGLAAIMSKYDTPVAAPAAAAPPIVTAAAAPIITTAAPAAVTPAALTPQQQAAMALMFKSSTGGVDQAAMDALGGSAAVRKLATSAGFDDSATGLYNYASKTPGAIDWKSKAGEQLASSYVAARDANAFTNKFKTPAEQALELMYRSTTTGAPTGAFDALGGTSAVRKLAESAGFDATPEWQQAYEKKMGYTVIPRMSTAETLAADKSASNAAAAKIGSQVTSNGIVDLKTDTGVKQDKTDTTTTGINQLATTKPADIKSNITTDGTYTGTSGTAPTMGTLFGQGKFVGTGTEMGTGTTGPILDFGGTSAFGTASPLSLAKTQIAEQSAAKDAADKTKLDLYSQWGASNPKATNLEHANFVDKIGLDPAVAARLIGISPDQAQSAYNDAKYNKMTGDSEAAYRYLMGQGAYPTKSGVGEIMRPYSEATLGIPANPNRKYIYDPSTGKYNLNPDFVQQVNDPSGSVNYLLSPSEIFQYFKTNASQDDATTYDWAIANNLTPQDIASATGAPLSQVAAKWRAAKAKQATAAADKVAADKAAADKAAADASSSGGGGGDAMGGYYSRGQLNYEPQNFAMGGYAVGGGLGALGSYSDGGRLLRGPGDGVSDSIPATIGRKQQPARLADGEFVVPARIVSELGNGSTDAGAKKLYAMMDRVQRARGKTTGKNKVAANSRADKYLPA